VNGEAASEQYLDHRSAGRLDGHTDLAGRRPVGAGQYPIRQSGESGAAVGEPILGKNFAVRVEDAGLVRLGPPIDSDKPLEIRQSVVLLVEFDDGWAATTLADSCTWRSRRKLLTGHPSWQNRRGTCPLEVLMALSAQGLLPAACPTPRY